MTEMYDSTPAPYAGADPFDFDAAMDAAETPSYSGDLPAGKYVGYVWKAECHTITKGDHAGQPMAKIALRVMDGKMRGHSQDRAYFFKKVLPGEKPCLDYGFFKGDVATLNVDIAALGFTSWGAFIANGLDNLRNRIVEFEVKVKAGKNGGEFVNVYINRLVNGRAIEADLVALDEAGKRAPDTAMAGATSGGYDGFNLG